MARTTATNFSGGLQFPYATAATDIFKKEDVQTLAQAVDQHDHTAGKGKSVAPTNASVTNAMLGPDTARLNLLSNPGFEVWQRGNGPFSGSGSGTFTADGWQALTVPSDTLSVIKDDTNLDTTGGGLHCAACTFTLSGGAGATVLYQKLSSTESGLLNRTITLSVRVKTATANAVRVGIYNGSAYTYSSPHTGGGAYQTLSVTATVTAGAASVFAAISFVASCTAYVDNAMLVVGSQPADYAPLHPADDLARCLRYFESLTAVPAVVSLPLQAISTSIAAGSFQFRVLKPVTPTMTVLSPAASYGVTNAAGSAIAANSVNAGPQAIDRGAITIGVASGLVAGNCSFLAAMSANSAIIWEANP